MFRVFLYPTLTHTLLHQVHGSSLTHRSNPLCVCTHLSPSSQVKARWNTLDPSIRDALNKHTERQEAQAAELGDDPVYH